MNKTISAVLVALLLTAGVQIAWAVPYSTNFTGRLSDGDGPVDGTVALSFRIYALESADPLWEETHSVAADRGLVYVVLGSSTTLDDSIFDGSPVELEIVVNGTAMAPRTAVHSVPYAMRSGSSDRVGWMAPEDIQERVTGQCMVGSYIRAINIDGTVECETDSDAGGDITEIIAGQGVVGGGTDGVVTITADTNVLQARIADACPAGSSIQHINTDGSVICHTDSNSGGDITGITTGSGLTGGSTSGDISLGIDTDYVQRRVTQTCSAGSSIRAISSTGAVTCETDSDSGGDITAVNAGTGLLNGGNSGNVTLNADTNYLQRRVTQTCSAGSSIRAISSTGAVTCETDSDSGGDITAVNAGFGLSGGNTNGSATLSVDPTEFNGSTPTTAVSDSILINIPSTAYTTIKSIDISTPTKGHIVVMGSVKVYGLACSSSSTNVSVGWDSNTSGTPQHKTESGNLRESTESVSVFATFSVTSSGSYTYYLRGARTDNDCIAVHAAYSNLTALFIPD